MSKFMKITVVSVLIIKSLSIIKCIDEDLWEKARQDLAERTRRYIMRNPISDQLQMFIDRLSGSERKKRDPNDYYASPEPKATEPSAINKVLKDVQDLVDSQKKGPASTKEGVICNVTGIWESQLGGLSFNIKESPNNKAKVLLQTANHSGSDAFLAQNKWNASVKIAFPQHSQVVITLTAQKGRRAAIFVGECRVCDGHQSISGNWLIGRGSKTCQDQKTSHSFVYDILRKSKEQYLKEKLLKSTTVDSLDSGGEEEQNLRK